MAQQITDGPIQVMLKDPLRAEAVRASEALGTSVTSLIHVVLEDMVASGSLEATYLVALQKRVDTARASA
jgi:hypothetical protein